MRFYLLVLLLPHILLLSLFSLVYVALLASRRLVVSVWASSFRFGCVLLLAVRLFGSYTRAKLPHSVSYVTVPVTPKGYGAVTPGQRG